MNYTQEETAYIRIIKSKPTIQRFIYWIEERERIRLLKLSGSSRPWTSDPILNRFRFCCPRRMDDKVSRWLLKRWYEPYFGHERMLYACALARFFNNTTALESIRFHVFENHSPYKIQKTLRELKSSGKTIFNGAYMVRGVEGIDKVEMVVVQCCQPLLDNPPQISYNSIQEAVTTLSTYWGFSSFMAGQVVADLRWAAEGKWSDKDSWAAVGPGSSRGMNRLLCRDIKTKCTQEEFDMFLKLMISECKRQLPASITSRLEAIDYQNTFCEFDKYERALWGQGVPKQLYR